MIGLVVKKQANHFTIDAKNQSYVCTARGNLKKDGVFVGDNVEFLENEKQIVKVLERKNKLLRPPLANLDSLVILITTSPIPDFYLLDKLILFCEVNDITPIICHSKTDLGNTYIDYIKKVYGKYYQICAISSFENIGITELKTLIQGKISAVAGQSGVGKSALLNAIIGENISIVGDLSSKIERGKQTTRHSQLFKIANNTYLADTAGFSSLDEKFLPITAKELPYYYKDFITYLPKCKFKSCTHTNEPDCAVKNAIKSGEIDKKRYERYLTIYQNLKNM